MSVKLHTGKQNHSMSYGNERGDIEIRKCRYVGKSCMTKGHEGCS